MAQAGGHGAEHQPVILDQQQGSFRVCEFMMIPS
jgi:hypothetical protein